MPEEFVLTIDTTAYILLVFGLFVVPQLLERLHIPGAITAVLRSQRSLQEFRVETATVY